MENTHFNSQKRTEDIISFFTSALISAVVPDLGGLIWLVELGILIGPDNYEKLIDDMILASTKENKINYFGILYIKDASSGSYLYSY